MNSLIAATNPISKPNCAWICHIQLKLWHFCDIFVYFGQNLVAMETSLRPLQSEMSSLYWSTTKKPLLYVIMFSLSLVEMHLYAFISTLVQKLVAMVTPLCPLCTGVSQTNFLMVQPYLKTKLCMDMLHTTEVTAIFVIFFAYFGQNLVVMATSLRPLQSEMSYWDCSTTKTPCCK